MQRACDDTLRALLLLPDAIVILPDHLHAVWTRPQGDADFSTRWRLIKTAFSNRRPPSHLTLNSKRDRGEMGIQQRRYCEHLIRDEGDLAAPISCCWGNPMKPGFVVLAVDRPCSSRTRDIRLRRGSSEWPGGVKDGKFGE